MILTCHVHHCHVHDCFRLHYPHAFRDPPPQRSVAEEANHIRASVNQAMENLGRARRGDEG